MPRRKPVEIRDRITELRRVPASELIPNPSNWRTHPEKQRKALQGVLVDVGYADALLVRETPDGLILIDGHLRAETTPEQLVPVLVLDLNEAEAAKLLAVLDPLASLAGTDSQQLDQLLKGVETDDEWLQEFLTSLSQDIILPQEADSLSEPEPIPAAVTQPESFQVLVKCDDEAAQVELLERLGSEGYECRALIA